MARIFALGKQLERTWQALSVMPAPVQVFPDPARRWSAQLLG
ncbi:MAG: hypothetical protein WA895_33210 [Streptosporangiaceae bacterium]